MAEAAQRMAGEIGEVICMGDAEGQEEQVDKPGSRPTSLSFGTKIKNKAPLSHEASAPSDSVTGEYDGCLGWCKVKIDEHRRQKARFHAVARS